MFDSITFREQLDYNILRCERVMQNDLFTNVVSGDGARVAEGKRGK